MKIARTMLASAAALGLAAAPIAAQAAPARGASNVAQSQKLAGDENAIAYVALAAFAVALVIILATTDNGHGRPASP